VTVLVTRRLETGGDSNSARSVALIETANLSGEEVSVALRVRVLTEVSAAATLTAGVGVAGWIGTSAGASIAGSATVGLDSSANTTVLEDVFFGLDRGRPVSRAWHTSGDCCGAGVLRPPFCGDASRPVSFSAAPGVLGSRAGSLLPESDVPEPSFVGVFFLGDFEGFGDLGGFGETCDGPSRSANRLLFVGDFGDFKGLGALARLGELGASPSRPANRFFCGDSGGGGGGVGAGGGSGGWIGLRLVVRVR